MSVPIVRTIPDLRRHVAAWRREGLRLALVPTMGALHEGHLSLVRAAQARADRVIVTLFVNPRQFNRAGDLADYPRTEHEDAAKLATIHADLLYAPEAGQMYPSGFATNITVGGVGEGLCGAARPGHFDGVATVVAKLLIQAGTDVALFGEKDFQQLHVVRRLVRDLDLPVEIVACPTLREADGLAMSSRNSKLSAQERKTAPRLAQILFDTADRLVAGEPVREALTSAEAAILSAGFGAIDYVELRAEEDLAVMTQVNRPGRLLAAAWLGDTRLIDNVKVAARDLRLA